MLRSWFLLAVLTAVIYGAQAVYLKAFTGRIDRALVAWSVFGFGAPVFVVLLLFQGVPTVEPRFWPAAAVSLAANLVAWPLFVRSLQISDVSLVMPLAALTPAFVLLVEWLVLGALPGGFGLVGILVIIVGAYVLNVQPRDETTSGLTRALVAPLRSLASDRGALMMLGVAGIWSISSTMEKITVTSSSPAFYLTVLSGGFALLSLPLVLRGSRPFAQMRKSVLVLIGAGLITALMLVVQMQALETTPLVNYVVAIKRAGMMVSVLAGWFFFGEENILWRAVGAALMVGGVALIGLV